MKKFIVYSLITAWCLVMCGESSAFCRKHRFGGRRLGQRFHLLRHCR